MRTGSKIIYDRNRRGDILAVETTWRSSPFAWAIRGVQWRKGYNAVDRKTYHWAQITTDGGEILESEPFRFRRANISRYSKYHVFRHRGNKTNKKRDEVVRMAEKVKDEAKHFMPYDEALIVSLLLQAIGIPIIINGQHETICTEYVYLAHKLAGLEMPATFYPAEIWQMWRDGIVDMIVPSEKACGAIITKGEER